jgi:hypothetical protein
VSGEPNDNINNKHTPAGQLGVEWPKPVPHTGAALVLATCCVHTFAHGSFRAPRYLMVTHDQAPTWSTIFRSAGERLCICGYGCTRPDACVSVFCTTQRATVYQMIQNVGQKPEQVFYLHCAQSSFGLDRWMRSTCIR